MTLPKEPHGVAGYVSFSELPTSRDYAMLEGGQGYYYRDPAGVVTAHYHNGEPMRFLGLIGYSSAATRGDHYHLLRTENLLVISGTLRARFALPEALDEVIEARLTQGQMVSVRPGCGHSYLAVGEALALEFCPEPFYVADTVTCEIPWATPDRIS